MFQLSFILPLLVPAPEFNYMGQSSASSTPKSRGTGIKWPEDMADYSVASSASPSKKPKNVTSQAETTTNFTNTLQISKGSLIQGATNSKAPIEI